MAPKPKLVDVLIVSLWLRVLASASASSSEVAGFDRYSNPRCSSFKELEVCHPADLITKRDLLVLMLRRNSGNARSKILECLEELKSLDLNDPICFVEVSREPFATEECVDHPEEALTTTLSSVLEEVTTIESSRGEVSILNRETSL